MTRLTAALACVISMILFSTIASAVTESLLHLRERGLQLMSKQLFEQHIAPHIAPRLAATGQQVSTAAREESVAAITCNRAVAASGRIILAPGGRPLGTR